MNYQDLRINQIDNTPPVERPRVNHNPPPQMGVFAALLLAATGNQPKEPKRHGNQ